MLRKIASLTALVMLTGTATAHATIRDFLLHWSGAGFDNTAAATAFLVIDDTMINNPGFTSGTSYVTGLSLTVSGASVGNGVFDQTDFDDVILYTNGGTLDLTKELVGQPTNADSWGTLSDDGSGGDFNLFGIEDTPAPNGENYFVLATNGGATSNSDAMALTSFTPLLCNAAATCLEAPASKLQIGDSDKAGKDKLSWQWGKGATFAQAAIGTPTTTTSYMLCIYDSTTDIPVLRAAYNVGPSSTLWQESDPKGAKFKDKEGTSGIIQLQLKTGDAGKTKVKIQGKGMGLVLPGPAGTAYFAQDTTVMVQLINSTGACWTSSFAAADTTTNDAGKFKAQTK
jgi:hypothetical protein